MKTASTRLRVARPHPTRDGRAGYALIEMMLASVVLVVAILGTVGSLTSSAMLGESTRETTIAYLAAQEMIEVLQATPCQDVFVNYNEEADDDPGGIGAAPGPGFAVPGLNPQADDPDGLPGRILMPQAGKDLKEDLDDYPELGMPRDLNADGEIDGDKRQKDYILLPVIARVEWIGVSGERSVEIETVLGFRK